MIRANIRAIFKSTTQTKISPIWYLYNQHAELDFNSASSPKQQSADRHVAPLGHIILIPTQLIFVLTPYFSVLSRETTKNNFNEIAELMQTWR
jgi:quinol-cytochrome oxidoreductase complex cytochrome b subunit